MSQDPAYICAGGPKCKLKPPVAQLPRLPKASNLFPGTPAPVPHRRALLSPQEMGIRAGQAGGTAGLVPESWQKALSFHPMPFDT